MGKLFSTCLLVQDGVSVPECIKTEINLHPGTGYSPDQGSSIMLAGGFTSISPESGLPLSPTLQLNLDMTSASSKDLEEIANAELTRCNSVNYRSYAVETNKRVCVIGSDSRQLQKFVDTFGGLLEVVPLLTKGYSQEFPTVLDLKVSKGKSGCHLDYQVQSPIQLDLCTYCGACGPVCPEKCISEDLYLDFGKCTFCKGCEKVCLAGAIDVHSAVVEILDIPAIILLDGQEIEAAELADKIYTQENLHQYLATLYPSQIDEVVSCDNSICQYSGRLDFGCRICLTNCQYGAISATGEGIQVDSLKCEECGACVSACPTGALQNERFSDPSFLNYLKRIHLPIDGTIVLGTEKSLHSLWWQHKAMTFPGTFFLQFENVQSLSLFHFSCLLDGGARRIVVLSDDSGSGQELARQIALTNTIIAGLFGATDAVCQTSPGDLVALLQAETHGSFGCNTDTEFSFINRRQIISKTLGGLVLRSGLETALSREDGFLGFASLSCDENKCTHCMACLNDCRIGAMVAQEQQLTLSHLGIMCVGCNICVKVCPENALSISPNISINTTLFSPVELAKAEPMECKKCGKVFGTKKSFERVMAILRAKETVDTSHFEYCETCRVVNLFEAE